MFDPIPAILSPLCASFGGLFGYTVNPNLRFINDYTDRYSPGLLLREQKHIARGGILDYRNASVRHCNGVPHLRNHNTALVIRVTMNDRGLRQGLATMNLVLEFYHLDSLVACWRDCAVFHSDRPLLPVRGMLVRSLQIAPGQLHSLTPLPITELGCL